MGNFCNKEKAELNNLIKNEDLNMETLFRLHKEVKEHNYGGYTKLKNENPKLYKEMDDWYDNLIEKQPNIVSLQNIPNDSFERSIQDMVQTHHKLLKTQVEKDCQIEGKEPRKIIPLNAKPEEFNDLQPEDIIEVCHNTRDLTPFKKDGIDVSYSPSSRNFYGSDVDPTGLYVSNNKMICGSFGTKQLIIQVPAIHLSIPEVYYRFGDKGELDNERVNREREYQRQKFPHSFDPLLTYHLTSKGESQAVLKKNIPKDQIKFRD